MSQVPSRGGILDSKYVCGFRGGEGRIRGFSPPIQLEEAPLISVLMTGLSVSLLIKERFPLLQKDLTTSGIAAIGGARLW